MVSVDDYWTVQNNVRGYRGGDGPAGAPGKSAYQIAVDSGFVGNEAAWLASLVGPEGETGENGEAGQRGSLWFQGSGTPSVSALPNDMYLDIDTGDIWQFT